MEFRHQRSLSYNGTDDSTSSDFSTSSESDIANEKSHQRKTTSKKLRPKFQYPKVTRLESWRRSGRRRMPTSAWKPDRIPPRERPSTSSYSTSSCENLETDDSTSPDSSTSSESDIANEKSHQRKTTRKRLRPKFQYPKVTRLVNWRRSGRRRMPTSAWKPDRTPPRKRPSTSSYSPSSCENLETRGRSRERCSRPRPTSSGSSSCKEVRTLETRGRSSIRHPPEVRKGTGKKTKVVDFFMRYSM